MDSVSQVLIKVLLRYALSGAGSWLMAHGLTAGQWEQALSGGALFLLALLYEGYTHVLARLHLNTALGLSDPASQAYVADLVSRGVKAPLSVPPDLAPRVMPPIYLVRR